MLCTIVSFHMLKERTRFAWCSFWAFYWCICLKYTIIIITPQASRLFISSTLFSYTVIGPTPVNVNTWPGLEYLFSTLLPALFFWFCCLNNSVAIDVRGTYPYCGWSSYSFCLPWLSRSWLWIVWVLVVDELLALHTYACRHLMLHTLRFAIARYVARVFTEFQACCWHFYRNCHSSDSFPLIDRPFLIVGWQTGTAHIFLSPIEVQQKFAE